MKFRSLMLSICYGFVSHSHPFPQDKPPTNILRLLLLLSGIIQLYICHLDQNLMHFIFDVDELHWGLCFYKTCCYLLCF